MRGLIDNMPIAAKAVLALSVLALFGLGAGFYAAGRLSQTNALYSQVIAEEVRAALSATRAAAAVNDDARALNRMLTEVERGAQEMRARQLAEVRGVVAETLAATARHSPALAGEIQAIEALYARLVDVTRGIEPLILAGDRARALALLDERRSPIFLELRGAIFGLVDRLERQMLAESAETTARTNAHWWGIVILLLGGAAVSLLVALWLMIAGVSEPMRRLTDRMATLRDGDHASPIPGIGRRDEVGRIAGALESSRLAMIEAARVAEALAAEATAKAVRGERVAALARDFEDEVAAALGIVGTAAQELDATARAMEASAEDGTGRAAALTAASERARESVATAVTSTNEMSGSIGEVTRQVNESARVARQAAEDARRTDAAVAGLAEAASRIDEVVRLIGGIAGQTNLLALNATIEAARAGEAGKGFAVVASEVKQLAAQTARATEEIATQITSMQAETKRAVEAIRGIGSTIEGMDGLTEQVAAAAERQAAAVQEISQAMAEAGTGTGEMTRHANGVADGAQDTGAAAARVRASASELTRRAEALRGQVHGFLGSIKAA